MSRMRTLAIVVVVVMLVTAGCVGTDQGDSEDGEMQGAAGDGDAADSEPEEVDDASSTDSQFQAVNRQLIRTAKLELRVDDYDATSDGIRDVATRHGGFVSDSRQQTRDRYNETYTTGTVTIRVPVESFDAAVADVRATGEVRAAETETDDVTDQLVDIEARLENLRAERDRLRALYDEANETEDVLAVQSELSRVQEEIERLEARQRALEDRVAYATITVHLSEPEPEPPEEEGASAWYDTGVLAAFLESVSGVSTVLRAMVVGAAYVLPYFAAFGIPIVGVVAVYRRWFAGGGVLGPG